MKIFIGVENYGKIKQAEIELGNLTIFVGNNNSGKTLMMQLMYGVLGELTESYEAGKVDGAIVEGDEIRFGQKWFENLEQDINHYLERNKENIVQKIFHTELGIERLYIRFVYEGDLYRCQCTEEILEANWEEAVFLPEERYFSSVNYYMSNDYVKEYCTSMAIYAKALAWKEVYKRATRGVILLVLKMWGNENKLFLPASRTGMLLLYKSFFAERSKLNEREIIYSQNEAGKDGNELGLTEPVYDFLRFLLQFQPNEQMMKDNAELIAFVENHLIDGKLENRGDEIYYMPQQSEMRIPLYMSSSLVNELAPLVRLFSSAKKYKYIFYDEIETCIHPLKQGELARLIIRTVNSGKRMIVSTHSDTMAVKLNNLLVLANKQYMQGNIGDLLDEMGLEKEDLLKTQDVHVYQFTNQSDGTSCVEELECVYEPGVGYDFSLFMKNLDQMYAETEILMR